MSIPKRVLLVSLLLGIIVSCIYGYFYFKRIKTPPGNALNAIPLDASLIIETSNIRDTWKKLSQSNLIWKDIIKTETFQSINNNAAYIDSLLSINKDIDEALNDYPVFISAQLTGENKIDFLFCLTLPNTIEEETVTKFLSNTGTTAKSDDNSQLNTININNKPAFSFAIDKGILLISTNISLIEKSLKQLSSGETLMTDINFKKVQKAAGDKPDAAVYINYKNLPALLSPFLNSAEVPRSLNNIAAWTEVDLTLKTNEILLSGYTSANDSANHYLSIFESQKPQEINVTNILPYNTAWFVFNGLSDIETFKTKQRKIFPDVNADKKIETALTSWVTNEIVLFACQSLTDQPLSYFAAFSTNDTLAAINQLKKLIPESDTLNNDTTYMGYKIFQLPLNNILAPTWGSAYKHIKNNFIAHIDNYIIFGNSTDELKQLIDNFSRNKTLANDEYYNDFFNGHLDSESNIYFYSSTGYSGELYRSLLNTEYEKLFTENDSLIKKIQAYGIQFSFDADLIYTTVFVKHNPVSKKQVSTIWETQLDTTITSSPQTVLNHHTKTKDIFIQDDANTIYLINATGQVLWKRLLPEKIIGSVAQVDGLNNNKLQLLFNTSSFIYLIDRNGDDVKNFPVKLPAASTAPLTVIDYENDKTYRILIPCSDKTIYNYSTNGELIKGWQNPTSAEIVETQALYFSVNKMDYIAYIDKVGNVKIVNRHGEEKILLNTTLENTNGSFKIVTGKNMDQTYIIGFDTIEHAIVRLYLDNKKENFKPDGIKENTGFICYDLNNDKTNEFILSNEQTLWAVNNDESILFENNFETEIKPVPYIFNSGSKGTFIGSISPSFEEVYIFDLAGNQLKGMPLKGIGGFTLDDINNDGTLFMICVGTSNRIFAYQIE